MLLTQSGTKFNGSHHGDNPPLRLTGIQIATKSYATLQAMTPTNIKTDHQTSLLHIESSTRVFAVAYPRPAAFSATKRRKYAPTSFDQQVSPSFSRPDTHRTKIMEGARLPKCVMFEKLVGDAGCVGGQKKEWMVCLLDDFRAFGINADQWKTTAQDEGEWRRTAE